MCPRAVAGISGCGTGNNYHKLYFHFPKGPSIFASDSSPPVHRSPPVTIQTDASQINLSLCRFLVIITVGCRRPRRHGPLSCWVLEDLTRTGADEETPLNTYVVIKECMMDGLAVLSPVCTTRASSMRARQWRRLSDVFAHGLRCEILRNRLQQSTTLRWICVNV